MEANMAMHDCDVMICIGARFDDRITGRLDAFSPGSKKIHIDIDAVVDQQERQGRYPDRRRLRACAGRHAAAVDAHEPAQPDKKRDGRLVEADRQVARPQVARLSQLERKSSSRNTRSSGCYELTKDKDVYITTEVGQHQMWAAQFFHFQEPNRWMTSGGLGTMGYGLPASVGVQMAHPNSLVIDIAGEASVQMTMQEISTAVQYRLPIKIFILNNRLHGHGPPVAGLAAWQPLFESYSEALPDFVKLAEAMHARRHPLPEAGRSRCMRSRR